MARRSPEQRTPLWVKMTAAGTVALGAAGLAGCSSDNGTTPEKSPTTASATATPGASETPTSTTEPTFNENDPSQTYVPEVYRDVPANVQELIDMDVDQFLQLSRDEQKPLLEWVYAHPGRWVQGGPDDIFIARYEEGSFLTAITPEEFAKLKPSKDDSAKKIMKIISYKLQVATSFTQINEFGYALNDTDMNQKLLGATFTSSEPGNRSAYLNREIEFYNTLLDDGTIDKIYRESPFAPTEDSLKSPILEAPDPFTGEDTEYVTITNTRRVIKDDEGTAIDYGPDRYFATMAFIDGDWVPVELATG